MLSHLSRLPASRLADWGYKVTVCIAGLSESRKKIVTVTDMKAGLGSFASDFVAPKSVFWRKWTIMYAGEDIESVPFIISAAKSSIAKLKGAVGPQDIADALDQAYAQRLNKIIETKVLRRYGYTSESFRKQGKKQLTASIYNSLCVGIASVKLSLRFLVAGFDKQGKGHILVAGGDEPPTDYTSLGFFAIGSGANAALSSLLFHKSKLRLTEQVSEGVCVYLLCEAKFMAEPGDVGRATFIALQSAENNGEPRFVTNADAIRELWESEGAPCLPKFTSVRIEKLIRTGADIKQSIAEKKEKHIRLQQKFDEFDPDIKNAIETLAVAAETGKLEMKKKQLPDGMVEMQFTKLNPRKRSEQK